MTINRLGEREVDAMIDSVVGNKVLPADVTADIMERTDGIPLFVEEMTKAVLEAESEGEARRTAAAVPSPAHGGPRKLARLADGASRPAGASQGRGPDGRGLRSRVLLRTAGRCCRLEREGAHELARKPHEFRSVVPRGAPLRTRRTFSSMPWFATRPMECCCGRSAKNFTPGLEPSSRRFSRMQRRDSPIFSRITSRKGACRKRPLNIGSRLENSRLTACQ